MTAYPRPSVEHMRTAFKAEGVAFLEELRCSSRFRGGQPWALGLRASTVHHTAGVDSRAWLLHKDGPYPFANALITNGVYNADDGLVRIMSWGSCWHSGTGGPWAGVSGEDSLHRVSWGTEIESKGTRSDITAAQIESMHRINRALIRLGMPSKNIHRHADWTDATGPVTGPLRRRSNGHTTKGRKIDTNAKWYPTALWAKGAAGVAHPLPPAPEPVKATRIEKETDVITNEDLGRISRAVWSTPFKEFVDENHNGKNDARTTSDILYSSHSSIVSLKARMAAVEARLIGKS